MTVKVGIMSFAHLHADSYALCLKQHPQAELVGVADHDQARAKAKALQFERRHSIATKRCWRPMCRQ
jgi:UDP-N-acetylglucosamine 3-dehydrogenase